MKRSEPTSKRGRFRFIGEIIGELKKVVWPSRNEAIRLTIMVLIVSLVAGLILGAIDYGFTHLVNDVFLGGR